MARHERHAEPETRAEDTGVVPTEEQLARADARANSENDKDRAPESLVSDTASGRGEGDGDPLEDQDLRVAGVEDIGAGKGLDEAELGRTRPLDHKKWDGNPREPYGE